MGDKVRGAAEATDAVVAPSAGLVPPIRIAWEVLGVAWKAATATAREQSAWQSWRERSYGERQATFEQVAQARKEAEEWRDALGIGMAVLVQWPFFALFWLLMLPSASFFDPHADTDGTNDRVLWPVGMAFPDVAVPHVGGTDGRVVAVGSHSLRVRPVRRCSAQRLHRLAGDRPSANVG